MTNKHWILSVLITLLSVLSLWYPVYAMDDACARIMVVTSPNYDNYTVGEELTVDIYIRDEKWKRLNPYTKIYIEKNHPKPAFKKYLGRARGRDLENPSSKFHFTLKEEWLTSAQKDVPYHVRVAWDKPEPCHEFSEDFFFHR
ncbi:hypothetical protein BG015_002604 [Linnemannia schmuckeri]|uniref:Uncharacterized protein n=1 Tax=Linnemannia schmuckeri TaxID=64567 RepID=A0A9P5RND5_9FUNG|nr:hypothetical protein BG015_002604 [Linnemannia schmuckeri]